MNNQTSEKLLSYSGKFETCSLRGRPVAVTLYRRLLFKERLVMQPNTAASVGRRVCVATNVRGWRAPCKGGVFPVGESPTWLSLVVEGR